MVKLKETTTFKDETKKPVVNEKSFATMKRLTKALDVFGIDNKLKCDLKLYQKCTVKYDDAETVIEIINEPAIVLTDAK